MFHNRTAASIFAFGLLAGMRSMAAPVFLSIYVRNVHPGELQDSTFRHLGAPLVSAFLVLMAGGELLADKLPGIPARTDPGPLTGRMLSGAFAGAVISRMQGNSVLGGALLGAGAAIAGSYAAYHLRRMLTRKAGLPDLPVALAEDAVVLLAGKTLSENL